jgi:ABC-type multidrug transport system ATPase subunit
MTGLLRIVDSPGEREIELPRGHISVGGSDSNSIQINGEGLPTSSAIAFEWNPRRATWVMQCAAALTFPVSINGRLVGPAEQFPLAHLDTVELPGVFMQFNRLLAEPMFGGHPVDRIPLGSKPLTIGRAEIDATVDPNRLDLDPEETSISRVHATIEPEGKDFILTDQSRVGMELNGIAFTRERLVFGDRFRISGYIFEFTGDAIRWIQPEMSGSIRARDLTVRVGERVILDNVSLDIAAGEFIGVLGGSGQGKSTLLNALCGINPPTSGEVRIGGVPLADRARLREIGIGYVPQDDIVHKELTVLDAITYSARLRLKLPPYQIQALVARVVSRLGLTEHTAKRVADLSGGQRKRVSIAIELLAKPSVLFLDEPSSGLDPAMEESLMTLLQSLTLTKLTVVCTTHVLQKAYLFDRILFVQGGKLVFAGNSNEARQHFLQDPAEELNLLQNSPLERIYGLLANSNKSASEWETEYRSSPLAIRAFPPLPPERPVKADYESLQRLKVGPRKTFLLLAARQWRILCSDRLNLAFILAQPLLIGFLVSWVADESAMRMFLCIVATMWFGCSNGAQQIVGELPIFRRERICGQGMNSYILSKLGFLSLVSLSQAVILFFTTLFFAQVFHPEKIDRENILKEIAIRLTPPTQPNAAKQQAAGFEAMSQDAPTRSSSSTTTEVEEKKPAGPNPLVVKSILSLSRFFHVTQNIIDSGPRVLMQADGSPILDSQDREMTMPGLPVSEVLCITLGLRFLAIAAAALVSVSIGLAISSLVKNTTQAVLWVPLVLIPQILFGGIVVSVPDMTKSVFMFSHAMPSFSAQRIMDVSALYGLLTPSLTNRTKKPLFLTSRGEKENVQWEDDGHAFSQAYDKLSPVNVSWQNLAVFSDRLGQHKQVGDRSEDGFSIFYRDTVESRRDVRFSKGTIFCSLIPFQISTITLCGWVALCYSTILFGLMAKQTGK